MGVREFRREDIAQTAELWLRVFRGQERPAPQRLRDYFQLIFFGAPWRDESLPSLVYEEGGRIAGFVGVIPRRMRFRGAPVRVAVVTQLMVDARARNRYAALALARRLTGAAHDLLYCDGSSPAADRLWSSCGVDILPVYSLNWFRPLRPAQYYAGLARERLRAAGGLGHAARALAPAARALDALLSLAPGPLRLRARDDGLREEPAASAELGWCLRALAGGRSLEPEHDPAALAWLLERAGEKRAHGELVRTLLRDRAGAIAGWSLYYVRPGGVAQVLHAGARPNRLRDVLHRLFRAARARGAVAVTGQLDPRHMWDYARAGCRFAWPGYSVLASARRPELMSAIYSGDARLTRLDGEWWARFSDPAWSDPEPEPLEKGVPACAASQAS